MGFLIKKPELPPETEPFNLVPRKTATNLAGKTWPVWWGIRESSGFWLTHLFNIKRQAITQNIQTGKRSSKEEVVGYNNFASYAMALGIGPADKLLKISSGGKQLWSGTVSRSDDLPAVVTVPDLGDVIFYWGTSGQGGRSGGETADEELLDIGAHPAYRDLIYFVAENHFFGEQTTPRTLEMKVIRLPKRLILDPANMSGDPENDADSYHEVDNEALLSEVAYDILTNELYALGENPDDIIDVDSFTDACDDYLTDGFGLSPYIEGTTDVRAFLGDLLGHHHAVINDVGGQLTFRILKSTDTVTNIPFADMLEEPSIEAGGWEKTFNKAMVNFNEQARGLEPLPAVYFDDANLSVVGTIRQKSFKRDFATTEEVANKIAAWIGIQGGLPEIPVKLVLNHTHSGIQPGDRLKFSHTKKGITDFPLVVKKVDIADPARADVRIEGEIDRLELLDPRAPDNDFSAGLEAVDPDDAYFRLAALSNYQLGDFSDGFLVAAARPNQLTTRAFIRASSDDTTYAELGSLSVFALRLQVLAWKDAGSGNVIFDVSFVTESDHEEWLEILSGQVYPDVYIVSGKRHIIATSGIDRPRLEPLWSILRFQSPVENLDTEMSAEFTTNYAANNELLSSTAHGLPNDQVVRVRNTGGSLPSGLAPDTDYHVVERTDDTFKLSATEGGSAITLSSNGSGTHEFYYVLDPSLVAEFTAATNDVITSNGHGLTDGTRIKVRNNGGALPAGLLAATVYYVRDADTNTFKVALTAGGSAVDITSTGSGTHEWYIYYHWRLRLTSGQFDTEIIRAEAGALYGIYPTEVAFLGPLDAFKQVRNDQFHFFQTLANGSDDTDLKRYIKLPTRIDGEVQDLADAYKVVYDRDGVPAQFTVTSGSVINSTAHGLSNGDRVIFRDISGGLPDGLLPGTVYYVIEKATDTFKVSDDLNGTAVTISTDATDTHEWLLVDGSYDLGWGDAVENDEDLGNPITTPEDDTESVYNDGFVQLTLDDNRGETPHTVEFTLELTATDGRVINGIYVDYDGSNEIFSGTTTVKVWTHEFVGVKTYLGSVSGEMYYKDGNRLWPAGSFEIPFAVTVDP